MNWLAWIILGLMLVQLFVAVSNLLWGKIKSEQTNGSVPLVSVLIPARNEENNIGLLLNDLLSQEYTNIEIIVFDDQSDDRTAGIVREISAKDTRVKLIISEGLPEGWLGKNHACHSLAMEAKGVFYLFLDADVRINGPMISRTVTISEKYGLGLLSVFPEQVMLTPGEWATVPVMNYILLTLLPLVLVRKSGYTSLAAANGQFMLFKADKYHEKLPHLIMRKNRVEDIEIARYFKSKQIKTACYFSDDNLHCRMYNGFHEAVSGFSRNVESFFGNSFFLALLFWLVTTFGFLAVLFGLPMRWIILYFAVVLLTRLLVSWASGQNLAKNLLFLIPQQFALGIFIYRAFISRSGRSFTWKGRKIH